MSISIYLSRNQAVSSFQACHVVIAAIFVFRSSYTPLQNTFFYINTRTHTKYETNYCLKEMPILYKSERWPLIALSSVFVNAAVALLIFPVLFFNKVTKSEAFCSERERQCSLLCFLCHISNTLHLRFI